MVLGLPRDSEPCLQHLLQRTHKLTFPLQLVRSQSTAFLALWAL